MERNGLGLLQTFQVKMRHGAHMYACTVTPTQHGTAKVYLDERDQGIAPGQFAVFYDDERCVGSGVIARSVVSRAWDV